MSSNLNGLRGEKREVFAQNLISLKTFLNQNFSMRLPNGFVYRQNSIHKFVDNRFQIAQELCHFGIESPKSPIFRRNSANFACHVFS